MRGFYLIWWENPKNKLCDIFRTLTKSDKNLAFEHDHFSHFATSYFLCYNDLCTDTGRDKSLV